MERFKGRYRVPSNRSRYWDYSWLGHYYITINVSDRKCILGQVLDSKMILSEYGRIVDDEIKKIPEYNNHITLEEWIVMPDHIHFIVTLNDFDFHNGISTIAGEPIPQPTDQQWWHIPDYKPTEEEIKQYRKLRRKMLLPKILGKFKHQTSKAINILRQSPGTRNWQADYYDIIIRDPASYQYIKTYIANNPAKWEKKKKEKEKREKGKGKFMNFLDFLSIEVRTENSRIFSISKKENS